jgi:DoxX-like family
MQPLLLFLEYLVIGIFLYYLLSLRLVKLKFAFGLFMIGGPAITLIGYAVLFIGDSHTTLQAIATPAMVVLKDAIRVVLGYCLGYLLAGLFSKAAQGDKGSSYTYSLYLVRGLSIQVGIIFIVSTIGKFQSMEYMRQFFHTSGYSNSFLYFIMTAECGFGLLLLFNLNFYLKLAAIIMLFSIMVGAVVTHARNGDPLSDSGNAILLGVTILIMAAIYGWRYRQKSAIKVALYP